MAIDAPYADIKSLLLQTVAEQSRCRSVFHVKLDLSTVMGFPADVAGVEVLFTSLLLQAQTALADAARRAPAGTRTRSQSYRSAFLVAYTDRVGDRLRQGNEAVLAGVAAERGGAFLFVLRARSAVVDDFRSARFGETVSSRVRGGFDAAGWAGGRIAADNAQRSLGDLDERRATGSWGGSTVQLRTSEPESSPPAPAMASSWPLTQRWTSWVCTRRAMAPMARRRKPSGWAIARSIWAESPSMS